MTLYMCTCIHYPGERNTYMYMQGLITVENMRLSHQISHVLLYGTTPSHLLLVQSKKVKKGALLSFNILQYYPLHACFSVKTPSSFLEFGHDRNRMINISRRSADISLTLTLTTYLCSPFHLGNHVHRPFEEEEEKGLGTYWLHVHCQSPSIWVTILHWIPSTYTHTSHRTYTTLTVSYVHTVYLCYLCICNNFTQMPHGLLVQRHRIR